MKKTVIAFPLLILLSLCGCGQQRTAEPQKPAEVAKAALPQTYGIYALIKGKYEQLNSSTTSTPILPPTVEFLVFDRSLTMGVGDPEQIVRLQRRTYVRKEVVHIKEAQDQPETGLEVKGAGYFLPTTTKFALRFGPVENRQDMLKAIPVSAMQRGLYNLNIGNENYTFNVDVSEQDGKRFFVVDKHTTAVKNQWSDRNEVVSTDYKDTSALDLAIQELKRSAQSFLQNNQLKHGFECARSYLLINPQDDAFVQEIRKQLVALYEEAGNRELWGCAILLAREASHLNVVGGKEMEEFAVGKLQEWNDKQSSSETERLQRAKTSLTTLWTQGSLELTIGNNLPDRGKDTRVTDIGVDATRLGAEAARLGYASINLWWGNDLGFQKEGDEQHPAIRFFRGYDQFAFWFPPGPDRDLMYDTCHDAFKNFRQNNHLARWSCEVTERNTVVWTLTCDANNTFSTPVKLPSDWGVVGMGGPNALITYCDTSKKMDTYLLNRNVYLLHSIKDVFPWNTPKYQSDSPQTPFNPPSDPIVILCDYRMYPDPNTADSGSMMPIPLTIEMTMP